MSFTIKNNLTFIDRFQFLSSSLDSLVENLVKNLNRDDLEYLNQEFENNVLELVKQKLVSKMSLFIISQYV